MFSIGVKKCKLNIEVTKSGSSHSFFLVFINANKLNIEKNGFIVTISV